MRRLTLALAVTLCSNLSAGERWLAEDGDTLWHGGKKVHLLGIDAPELPQICVDGAGRRQSCGRDTRDYVGRLIATGDVSCTIEGKDRYQNDLGVCFVGGIDLGRDLVQHGLAVVDRLAPRYLAEEREARTAKRGMWAGQFTDPADYRRAGR